MDSIEGERAVFNRAVHFILPSAIPTHLDRSQEYALGDVLVYEKKLRFLMPWRKHRLVFTGINLSELVDDTVPQITKTVTPVFDDASTSRTFGMGAKFDAEIRYAVAHFGAGVSASENATVSVDFGKVERHFSNLSSLLNNTLNKDRFSVSAVHPVIQEAIRNNRTIFVITSLYVADKANINVSFKSGTKDGVADNSKSKSQLTQSTPLAGDQTGTSTDSAQPTTTTITAPAVALQEGLGADVEISFTDTGKLG